MNECNLESVFDYTVELSSDGSIVIKDNCGCTLELSETGPTTIKRILNTRSLTITEFEGSGWAYVYPPGKWVQVK